MKKLLLGKIGIIALAVIIGIVGFGGIAYAAGVFQKDLPASASIKATTPGLTLYTDSACTTEVAAINFPEVSSGEDTSIQVYVKNTGNKSFDTVTSTNDLDPDIGTITVSGLTSMQPGIWRQVTITLSTVESSVDIAPEFNISFSGTY